MRRSRILPGLLLGLAALPAAWAARSAPEWNAPTPQWRSGPVRYLLTAAEDRAYKKLKTESARAEFIEAFWQRRDPDPATPDNEFLDQFIDRVDRSESLRIHLQSTKPIWLTDPGKYYILFGPPISDEVSQNATSTRDTIIWTWDEVPGVKQHHFTIAFVADESGEYRVSSTPAYDQATTQGLAAHTPAQFLSAARGFGMLVDAAAGGGPSNVAEARTSLTMAGLGPLWTDPVLEAAGAQGGVSELTQMLDLFRAESTVEPDARPEVRATPSFDPIPVQMHTDFYRAADGTTYAAFTFGAGGGMAPQEARRLVPFGGIVSLDDALITFPFDRADQFAAAGDEAPGTFQTGLGIDPGRYRVLFGLRDPGSGRAGVWRDDLTVPDLSRPGLDLSSLTLARVVRPLQEGEIPDTRLKVPFVLGGVRVVPRTDAELRNGDQFNVYFQVYGALTGSADPAVLDIAYRFEGRNGDEWIALGNPIEQNGLTGQVHAWSFPLQGWPPGEFRLIVQVVERSSGRSADASLRFAVVE